MKRRHYSTPCCYCSVTQSCLTLCDPMDCSAPGYPVLHCLLEFAQTHVRWVGDAMPPSNPLSPPSPPALNHSQHQSFPMSRLFVPGGHFSISPSRKYSGLISFKIDWFEVFAVYGTLKSLLQHHSSKASILQSSTFFTVQFSHPYETTGKTTALTIWTVVNKMMSLLFNMLSIFVIAFLPRSKHLLISQLQSLSAVILEPKKIKLITVSIFSPSLCHEVMGMDAMFLVFWMLSFKPTFLLSSCTFIKRLFSSSSNHTQK